jgi:RNA polymerase sigma factor (sigma-70 family)
VLGVFVNAGAPDSQAEAATELAFDEAVKEIRTGIVPRRKTIEVWAVGVGRRVAQAQAEALLNPSPMQPKMPHVPVSKLPTYKADPEQWALMLSAAVSVLRRDRGDEECREMAAKLLWPLTYHAAYKEVTQPLGIDNPFRKGGRNWDIRMEAARGVTIDTVMAVINQLAAGKGPRTDQPALVIAYVRKTVQNRAVNLVRDQVRDNKRHTSLDVSFKGEDGESEVWKNTLPANENDVNSLLLLERAELQDVVNTAIRDLSNDRQREIARLMTQGAGAQEIADLLGMKYSTAHEAIGRVRKQIEKAISGAIQEGEEKS